MPKVKGRVEPREVECRGCGTRFVSDLPGKAAWFCKTEACDKARGVTRRQRYVRTANRDAYLAERAEQRRGEALAKAQARLAVALERVQRERERLERVRADVRRVLDGARAIAHEVEQLGGGRHPLLEPPAPDPAPQPAPAPAITAGPLATFLADLPRQVATVRIDEDTNGRRRVQRAVVRLAHAQGASPTADALRAVAVEALSWERTLRQPQHLRAVDADAA